jgi:uncharacterized membrane protein YesL
MTCMPSCVVWVCVVQHTLLVVVHIIELVIVKKVLSTKKLIAHHYEIDIANVLVVCIIIIITRLSQLGTMLVGYVCCSQYYYQSSPFTTMLK